MTGSQRTTLPTYALIGVARAGTTAIAEALRRHPGAFFTTPKEPHYFAFAGQSLAFTGPGDDTGINQAAITDTGAYLALYDGSGDSLARGEGSVSTFYYYEHAIPAIHSLSPELRMIVVLRDPVDRAFSSFQYQRMRGREPESDFAAALAAEPSRREAGWHHIWHYTGMSRYADALEAFISTFGRERLCVLMYDDVVADPEAALQQVYRHLGLDPAGAPVPGAPRVNTSGETRLATVQAVANQLRRRPAIRKAGRLLVPFAARERLRRWNQGSASVPESMRRELAPTFAADLDRVERLLGRSVPRWGR